MTSSQKRRHFKKNVAVTTLRHVTRKKFFGGKRKFGKAMASPWRRSKKKGLLYGKPLFSTSFVVISKKKRPSVRKTTTFCDLYIKSKIIQYFFSILKLKDLSEIYLGGATEIGGGQLPPPSAPSGYVPVGKVTMMTS